MVVHQYFFLQENCENHVVKNNVLTKKLKLSRAIFFILFFCTRHLSGLDFDKFNPFKLPYSCRKLNQPLSKANLSQNINLLFFVFWYNLKGKLLELNLAHYLQVKVIINAIYGWCNVSISLLKYVKHGIVIFEYFNLHKKSRKNIAKLSTFTYFFKIKLSV